MILKYKVPKEFKKRLYENKRIIYCEIINEQKIDSTDLKVYKVKMVNYKNFTNIFGSYELKQLNIFDKIRLKLLKKGE